MNTINSISNNIYSYLNTTPAANTINTTANTGSVSTASSADPAFASTVVNLSAEGNLLNETFGSASPTIDPSALLNEISTANQYRNTQTSTNETPIKQIDQAILDAYTAFNSTNGTYTNDGSLSSITNLWGDLLKNNPNLAGQAVNNVGNQAIVGSLLSTIA